MTATTSFTANRFLHLVLTAYALVWVGAAINPRDWLTWVLENILVVIFAGLLAATFRRFTFSNISYLLIAIFLSLHAVGTHTGYAQSPIGDWLKELLNLSRNPYDRIIHFGFGLLLTYPFRELIVRTGNLRGWAANWSPVSLILAASIGFEVMESLVAEIVSPGTGPAWLGAQGDEWDMQSDLAAALLGSLAAGLITSWREHAAPGCGASSEWPVSPERGISVNEKSFRERWLLQGLCVCYVIVWVTAAVDPVKRSDWLLENLLVFVCVPILIFTYRRLPLSNSAYVFIFFFLIMHAAGAHYTYAEVPLGYWLKEAFHLERNPFDRIVHFSFGLMAYPVHEVWVRITKVHGFWGWLLPVSIVVSFSGFFEILEAIIAMLVNPELGAAYLGLQGDVWDAQKDMARAILGGALVAAIGRRRFYERSRSSVTPSFPAQ